MAKIVTCLHHSEVKTTKDGDISTCCLCGQQILITPTGEERILQRGKINGAMTDIHPQVSQPGAGETSPSSSVPPKPKKRKQLGAYYESNKDAILADYRSMSLLDFFRKRHLSASTWTHLKQKWNVVGKRRVSSKKRTLHIEPVKVPLDVKDSLPPLPAFSDSWDAAVQIEWLKTYKELRLAKE